MERVGEGSRYWRMQEIRHVDIDWPPDISNLVEAKQALFLNDLQILLSL